uniref:Uncharacterized protein n=1 Tax=Mustela putorius furo TaxID=9669 RepID=M3YVU4_MUSPF
MLSKRNHSDCRVRGCADHRNAETESNTRQPAREGPRSPEGRSGRKERVLGETGVFKPLSQPPLNCSALSPLPTGDPATATSVQESHGPPTPPLTRICGRICVALARPAALRYCAGRDFLRTTGNRKGLLSTGRREEAFPRSTRQGRVRPWRAESEDANARRVILKLPKSAGNVVWCRRRNSRLGRRPWFSLNRSIVRGGGRRVPESLVTEPRPGARFLHLQAIILSSASELFFLDG